MLNDGFQYLEQRDASDGITHAGVVSKKSAFATSDNQGIYDVIAEDLRYLYDNYGASNVQVILANIQSIYNEMKTDPNWGASAAALSAKDAIAAADKAAKAQEQADTDAKSAEAARTAAETANTAIQQALAEVTDYATKAQANAGAALTSEQNAKMSETNAKTSETNAADSAGLSKKWAVSTDSPDDAADTDSPTGKTRSSRSWALFSKAQAQIAEENVEKTQVVVNDAASALKDTFNEKYQNMNRVHFLNGMQLWLSEEGNKPVLRVSTEDGSIWKLADFVKESGAKYVLLSNGEVYNANWLQDRPNYVKTQLIDESDKPLQILKTIDADADVKKVQALTDQLDFDHFWDFTVDKSSGTASLNLDSLTTGKKYNRTATKDATTGKWTITGDDTYGELGIGYGQPYYYDPKTGHNTVLMPEFETVTQDEKLGLKMVRAKNPANVYPNAQAGDIYPVLPPTRNYIGDNAPSQLYNLMSNAGTHHITSVYPEDNATAENNPDYDVSTSGSGYNKVYIFTPKAEVVEAIWNSSSFSYDWSKDKIRSDIHAKDSFCGSTLPSWHIVAKYDGTVWRPADFMDGLTADDSMWPFESADIADIQCGRNFTVFLLTNGQVWTCGANFRGQLGAGEDADANNLVISPQPLDIESFSAVAATEQTWVAFGNNGILYGCGANSFGQFGQGDTKDRKVLTPLADYVERCELTAGNLIIRKTNGDVYGAGWNWDDRLNLGTCGLVTKFTKLSEVAN